MKTSDKYLVLEVREYSETVCNASINSVSSKHYFVLIVEDVMDKTRHRFDLSNDKILDGSYSQHPLVVAGDTIKIITEWDSQGKPKGAVYIL